MASLDHLNDLLRKSPELLDEASREIRDIRSSPEENMRRIGSALVGIFEIQHQIFEKRPDLKPGYLDQ